MRDEAGRLHGRLRELHADVTAWLRYAESKNGALAALAAGSLYAALSLLSVVAPAPLFWLVGLAGASFVLALVVGVCSFLPVTNPLFEGPGAGSRGSWSANVYYFASIARMPPEELLARLEPGTEASRLAPGERDLADQIVVLARLASRKLAFFEVAAWCYLAGIVTPVGAFLLYWVLGGPARRR